MARRELIFLITILALGAFFRFYLIAGIPPGLYPDEAANGNNALEALRTGALKVFYPENNGREGLFINLQALAIWVFGVEPWVLRIVSAIFGTLTILGIWLLAKELFSDEKRRASLVAALAAFFLATSFWHINFSRIGFRAILVPFFTAFALYLLLKGLRTGKISSTVMSGIFTGLGFYSYIAFRFLPFVIAVPIFFYVVQWLKDKPNLSVSIGRPIDTDIKSCTPCIVALFILITIVVALPLGFYFLQNPGDLFGRSGQVSIFSTANPLYEFAKSNALTFQMFFFRGDCNPRHNFACQPQLFWPLAIFFLIGLFLALRQTIRGVSVSFLDHQEARRHGSRLWRDAAPDVERVPSLDGTSVSKNDILAPLTLLGLFFFMLFPATLTWEGIPHALRSIGLIVPTFILAGWGAEFLWTSTGGWLDRMAQEQRWQQYLPQIHRIKIEVALLFALLLIFLGSNAYRTYFVRFPESPDTYYAFGAELKHIGQYLNRLPLETRKIVIVNLTGDLIRGIKAPAQTPMFLSDTFSEEKRREKKVEYLNELNGLALRPEEKAVIIPLNPNDKELIKEIKNRFPQLKPKAPADFVSFEN